MIGWVNSIPNLLPHITIKDMDYFDSHMFCEDVVRIFSAFKWWRCIKIRLEPKEKHFTSEILKSVIAFCMCKLHSIPGSSAGLERIFSNFSFIWTDLRNKLDPVKVDKLVEINGALNGK